MTSATADAPPHRARPRSARELLISAPLGDPVERAGSDDAVRAAVASVVRALAGSLGSAEPVPSLLQRWQLLASLGRRDLVVGRLVEGHLDALAILAEAGCASRPGAVYGVWASASGGTGLRLSTGADGRVLEGTLRFCSGARTVDRALVTATAGTGDLHLVDIAVDTGAMTLDAASWPAVGMDASDSLDISVTELRVRPDDVVGPPGFYLGRPGLPVGGIGVAAVWLGGAQGLLDASVALLRRFGADDHQLAHVGAVTAAIESAAATLVATAGLLASGRVVSPGASGGAGGAGSDQLATGGERVESASEAESPLSPQAPVTGWDLDTLHRMALTCRSAVEAAVSVALQRLPRLAGPVALTRDADYAHRLADLEVYVRQHHAERDLARLGAAELADPWSTAAGAGDE